MTTRFRYHGNPVPEWQARLLPDHLVIADHEGHNEGPFGTLIVRRRTEMYVPVPTATVRDAAA